jgi:hypothetical protein
MVLPMNDVSEGGATQHNAPGDNNVQDDMRKSTMSE